MKEKTSLIDMLKGAAHFFSRTPKSVGVTTSFVNAGVEGTEFLVRVDEKTAFISVFEGRVLASNQSGSVSLVSGQSAVAEPGKAPEIRIVAKPRDAVQWTLYFPAVAYYRPSDFQDLPANAHAAVRRSMDAYMRRDFKGAIDGLNVLPEDLRNPRLLAYRASLLLAVGRVDEARKDIDAALRIAHNSSDALAHQSIIATVRKAGRKTSWR